MKKLTFIYIALIGLLAFSCAKHEADPVLSVTDSTKPALTTPATGGTVVLLEDKANDLFAKFSWSAATYNLATLPDLTYTLQMDATTNNFSKPLVLVKQKANEKSYTVKEMNLFLLSKDFLPNVAKQVSFRVIASVSDASTLDDLVSGTTTLTLTPYSADIYVSPIYLLGDATIPGWSNANAIPFSHIKDGTFGIVTDLSGAGKYFKIISVLGKWAPMWGTDAAGTATGGKLVYRATEAATDPPAIPAPAAAGKYRIVADTVGLNYNVYPANANLYMLGDGCTAGWNNAAALPLTGNGKGVFTITSTLTGGGKVIKFIEVLGQWAPQWGAVAGATGFKGGLQWRQTEANPDPASIPVPATGTYLITVDLAAQKYKLTPQ